MSLQTSLILLYLCQSFSQSHIWKKSSARRQLIFRRCSLRVKQTALQSQIIRSLDGQLHLVVATIQLLLFVGAFWRINPVVKAENFALAHEFWPSRLLLALVVSHPQFFELLNPAALHHGGRHIDLRLVHAAVKAQVALIHRRLQGRRTSGTHHGF